MFLFLVVGRSRVAFIWPLVAHSFLAYKALREWWGQHEAIHVLKRGTAMVTFEVAEL